jgi:hypothetical protein
MKVFIERFVVWYSRNLPHVDAWTERKHLRLHLRKSG